MSLSHFRIIFFFASKRNEAKQKSFCFLFASFRENNKTVFRFPSLRFASIFSLRFASLCQFLLSSTTRKRQNRRLSLRCYFTVTIPSPVTTPYHLLQSIPIRHQSSTLTINHHLASYLTIYYHLSPFSPFGSRT